MVNWDYVKDSSVKIDEFAVSPGAVEDAVILKGKKSLSGNVYDAYFYLHDVPKTNSEQILSLTGIGNLDTNFIRDVMECTGRHVESIYLEEHFHKGKPTKFARSFLKFSTGKEINSAWPVTSLVFGLASRTEIYVNQRICDEKNRYSEELRKIIESVDFRSLEDLPAERGKTEVDFNPNGYEELENSGHVSVTKLVSEKKITRRILTANYSKNGDTFLFPIPTPEDRLVLEKYADKLEDPSDREIMKGTLENNPRQIEHMEILNYILNNIRTDSVFINGKIKESPKAPNVFLVEPVNTYIRLEMNGLKTFKTSYFFGFNSAFLNLDKIMLKPEMKLPYVS